MRKKNYGYVGSYDAKKQRRKNRSPLPWIILICLIIGLGITAFFQYRNYQEADTYKARALEYFEAKSYQEAQANFESALQKKSIFGISLAKDVNYYLAETLFLQEEYEEALTVYEALFHKNQTDTSLLCFMGACHAKLGDTDKALELFEEAKDLGDKKSFHYLSKMYYDLEDYQKAITYEEQYIKENPTEGLSYIILAKGYAENKEYKKALKAIDDGLKLNDDSARQELLFQEIVTYEKQLDFDTAYEKCKAYILEYPDDAAAKSELEFLESR